MSLLATSAVAGLGYGSYSFFTGPTFKNIDLAGNIAVIQERQQNPFASKEDLKKAYDSAPKGLENLAGALAEVKKNGKASGDRTQELLHKFDDPIADGRQAPGATEGSLKPATPSTAQVAVAPSPSASPLQKSTEIVVIAGSGFVDPSAVDKIKRLAISDALKKQILDNYKRTGILPTIDGPETSLASERTPSSQR